MTDISRFRDPTVEKVVFTGWMICAVFNVFSCWVVIRECVQDIKEKNRKASPKAISVQIISMCIGHVLHGMAHSFGMMPVPKDQNIWGSMGNQTTCNLQGFIIFIGIIPALILNVSVIFLYTLIIRYNIKDDRLWKFVLFTNIIAWTVGIVMASLPLTKEAFNFSGYVCGFLAVFPDGCLGDEHIQCTRGGDTTFGAFWRSSEIVIYSICLAIGILNFFLIYFSVRNVENRAARYRYGDVESISMALSTLSFNSPNIKSTNVDRRQSKSVALQAYYHIGLHLSAFGINALAAVVKSPLIWCLRTTVVILLGFFYAIIYSRTRDMKTAEGKMFRSILCCSHCQRSEETITTTKGVHIPSMIREDAIGENSDVSCCGSLPKNSSNDRISGDG